MSDLDSFGGLRRPTADERTLVGKLPLSTDGHVIGSPIPAMVERALDAADTRNPGEHALDFHLEIWERVAQR
jgi:hypothetical protein